MEESAWDLMRQTPGLFGWDRLSPGYLRALHQNLLTFGLPNQSSPRSIRNNLDNFEPFNDLEDWSDNIDFFMDAMTNPPEHADALWELAKIKNPGLIQ